MRGYPPIHLLLLMLAFGALAVPLVNLTTARTATASAPRVEQAPNSHESRLRLRFAHQPKTVSLKVSDKDLLAGVQPRDSLFEAKAELSIPVDGIEFILTAEWPEGTADTALTLEIEPDGLDGKTETRWSSGGALTEVISFQWKQ